MGIKFITINEYSDTAQNSYKHNTDKFNAVYHAYMKHLEKLKIKKLLRGNSKLLSVRSKEGLNDT